MLKKMIEYIQKEHKSISWVGWLNILFFQWFCIRLYKYYGGTDNVTGQPAVTAYGLMGLIKPLTGWWDTYGPITKQQWYLQWDKDLPKVTKEN